MEIMEKIQKIQQLLALFFSVGVGIGSIYFNILRKQNEEIKKMIQELKNTIK